MHSNSDSFPGYLTYTNYTLNEIWASTDFNSPNHSTEWNSQITHQLIIISGGNVIFHFCCVPDLFTPQSSIVTTLGSVCQNHIQSLSVYKYVDWWGWKCCKAIRTQRRTNQRQLAGNDVFRRKTSSEASATFMQTHTKKNAQKVWILRAA